MSDDLVVWGLAGAHVIAAVGSAFALKWLLRLLAEHPDDGDGGDGRPGGGGWGGGGGPRGPWGGGLPLGHFEPGPRRARPRPDLRRGGHVRRPPVRPRKTRAGVDAHQS